MPWRIDLFGSIQEAFFYAAPDPFLFRAIQCSAPLLDWFLGSESLFSDTSGSNQQHFIDVKTMFYYQVSFFAAALFLPFLAIKIDHEVGSLWTQIVFSGTAPLMSAVMNLNTRARSKLFYALIISFSLVLALPHVSLSALERFATPSGACAALILLLATFSTVMYTKTQEIIGQHRVVLAAFSTAMFLPFVQWSKLLQPTVWMQCILYFAASWAYGRTQSRYSAQVKNNSYIMAVANVEKIATCLLFSYPVLSKTNKNRGSFPFVLLTLVACYFAPK